MSDCPSPASGNQLWPRSRSEYATDEALVLSADCTSTSSLASSPLLKPTLSVHPTSSFSEKPLTDRFLRRVAASLFDVGTTYAERRRKGSTTPGSVYTLEARSIEGATGSLGRQRFETVDSCLCLYRSVCAFWRNSQRLDNISRIFL